MNHLEKFREKYKHRAQKNKDNLEHALPDQVPEFTTLEKFDHARIKHFTEALRKEQKKLNKQKTEDISAQNEISNENANLKGEIDKEKSELKTDKDNYEFKLAGLESQRAQIEEMVHAEEKLDEQRRENEKKEEEESNEAQKAQQNAAQKEQQTEAQVEEVIVSA